MSVDAMKQGKHVLCEKPLATTPADAEEIVATAKTTGAKLMTNFNHRAHDHMRRAREILDQGRIGRPTFFRGRIGHSRFVVGPSPEGPDRFRGKSIWNLDATQSGEGTLIDNGVHVLDLARWFEERDRVPSGRDGLRAARMVHALYGSAASGEAEAIPAGTAV